MTTDILGRKQAWLFLLIFLGVWSACKKHDNPKPKPVDHDSTGVTQLSDEDSLKFYVWYINESDSQNIPLYLWYDQVPKLNPFSPLFANADSLLSGSHGIASYPVVNGQKVDRYSFLDRSGAVTGEIQEGQGGDFGFDFSWVIVDPTQKTTAIFIKYAYAGSPAGNAGVQRGWQITAVNGNSNVSFDGTSGGTVFGDGTGKNVNRVINAFYSNSASFTFKKPDGTTVTASLSRTPYHINPVLFDTVYNVNGSNVGYFVYNSFVDVGDDDSTVTVAEKEINNVFSKFQAAGIKNLIVDLRYNGGGAVTSAEYLDNLIVPAAGDNQLMYKYTYNDQLTSYAQVFPDAVPSSQNFSKMGSLALDNVFFIVDGGTASASELTINNLKPYMSVKIIGRNTYGKPVGFFTIPISVFKNGQEKLLAEMYAINFRTVNSQDQGDYYNGFTPDKTENDYIGYNWGDAQDPRLQDAFNYIKTGSFARSGSQEARLRLKPQAVPGMNRIQAERNFRGIINFKAGRQIFKRLQGELRRRQ